MKLIDMQMPRPERPKLNRLDKALMTLSLVAGGSFILMIFAVLGVIALMVEG